MDPLSGLWSELSCELWQVAGRGGAKGGARMEWGPACAAAACRVRKPPCAWVRISDMSMSVDTKPDSHELFKNAHSFKCGHTFCL